MADPGDALVAADAGLPRLYSFRRCPYAIRARLAIQASGTEVELREILLRDKPTQMLEISAKGTVPVLQLSNGEVIDESRQIIDWALTQHDPADWALSNEPALRQQAAQLIDRNDGEFKELLDRYKYAVRFPEHPAEYYRDAAMEILSDVDQRLAAGGYLLAGRETVADIALYPFVRQFAFVDKKWFDHQPLPNLKSWLEKFLTTESFAAVMVKLPPWLAETNGVKFPFQPINGD
ncbi:MAG: glutathione S-transferase [Immundisolibacteraceae bacterium]|nr:glutathione S-transferase [Immundisolibacteraceae bacterium]